MLPIVLIRLDAQLTLFRSLRVFCDPATPRHITRFSFFYGVLYASNVSAIPQPIQAWYGYNLFSPQAMHFTIDNIDISFGVQKDPTIIFTQYL